jgi:hypothetical protein
MSRGILALKIAPIELKRFAGTWKKLAQAFIRGYLISHRSEERHDFQ